MGRCWYAAVDPPAVCRPSTRQQGIHLTSSLIVRIDTLLIIEIHIYCILLYGQWQSKYFLHIRAL